MPLYVFAGSPITYTELTKELKAQDSSLDLVSLPKDAEAVKALSKKVLAKTNRVISKVLSRPAQDVSFTNTVLAFDAMIYELSQTIGILTLVVQLDNRDDRAKAARKELILLQRSYDGLYLRPELFDRLDLLTGLSGLDEEQKRLLEVILENFAAKPKKLKAVLDALEMEGLSKGLEEKSATYSENIYKRTPVRFTRAQLDGVPDVFFSRFKKDGRDYVIDPSQWDQYDPILRFCDVDETRKEIWLASQTGAPAENKELLDLILGARRRKADRLGYVSWADYQLDSLSTTPGGLLKQFSQIRRMSESAFKREHKEMTGRLGRKPEVWDLLYVTSQMNEEKGISDELVREYFEFENVLEGLIRFLEGFFEVQIRQVTGAPVWGEARVYAVTNESDGKQLGVFLLDPFSREGKEPWFMVQSITTAESLPSGHRKIASTLLHTAFAPPGPEGVSLMGFEEVWTLFHEIGHVMHELFPNQKYFSLSPEGSNYDLVEYPAIVLERLSWEPEIIGSIAKHWKTGDPMPADMVKHLSESRTTLGVHAMRKRSAESVIDLKLHLARRRDIGDVEEDVLSEWYYPLPEGKFMTPSSRFIVEYDGYGWIYSWGDALAQATRDIIKDSPGGLTAKGAGVKFRKAFLEAGSRYTSSELIDRSVGKDFRFCRSLLAHAGEGKKGSGRRHGRKR